jgi:Insertion element 4 transposase N-terminal/Transposase DDE domain
MARTKAQLSAGSRITDYISLGVVAKWFPREKVDGVLAQTGKASRRQRDLPAHVVVYYVIALALFMQVSYREVLRCLLEGLQWLAGPNTRLKVAGDSGISQARRRVGVEPLRKLHDEVVKPLADGNTRGAWYGRWRLVTLDGSTLDVADEASNREAFGLPGASRGDSAYPQIRFVSLLENGTHVLFGSRCGKYATGEITLAKEVLQSLQPGMLCLADRNYLGYGLWQQARQTGAALLWRAKTHLRLEVLERYADGSYRSAIYASERDWRKRRDPLELRVIEYRLAAGSDGEDLYRLVTTLSPQQAPAQELAVLYHERWEIEGALDELKTHLRGARIVLRSKTPQLVEQEFYGLLMAHYAVRGLMHEAALRADKDPDRLSYTHAVRVVRRKLPAAVAIPPSAKKRLS